VVAECAALAGVGVREVTLIGQNVNSYRGGCTFAELLRRVAAVPGIARVRFTTSHPHDLSDELVEVFRDEPRVMPHFHLPVQSGSDPVLARMRRDYTVEGYLDRFRRLSEARSGIAITTDFIVGFPGESETDFAATMKLVEEIGFAQAYSFNYSIRPGTPGAAMENQVPEAVKDERLQRLQAVLNAQQVAFNRAMIGRVLPVLLEKPGKRAGQLVGRSPYLQAVHVMADASEIGRVVDLRIDDIGHFSMSGSRALPEPSVPYSNPLQEAVA
jgi:tRNA-2-methylthio-N6-dimethylallyladenosine synthase